jgi:phosphate:Na+ symporter
LTFNLLSIITGLILFKPFMSLVHYLSTSVSIERAVANSHMIFNIGGVLIFVWFLPYFEKLLNRIFDVKHKY